MAAIVMLAAGCGTDSGGGIPPLAEGKWGTGEVVNDIGAMIARVPSLETATSVAYTGGTQTQPATERDLTVPGRSDYWIDAVVAFAPGDSVPGRECGTSDAVEAPGVVPPLTSALSDGPWLGCVQGAFPAEGWTVRAFFDASHHIVVLHLTQN